MQESRATAEKCAATTPVGHLYRITARVKRDDESYDHALATFYIDDENRGPEWARGQAITLIQGVRGPRGLTIYTLVHGHDRPPRPWTVS